jgi:hypothetical protein
MGVVGAGRGGPPRRGHAPTPGPRPRQAGWPCCGRREHATPGSRELPRRPRQVAGGHDAGRAPAARAQGRGRADRARGGGRRWRFGRGENERVLVPELEIVGSRERR